VQRRTSSTTAFAASATVPARPRRSRLTIRFDASAPQQTEVRICTGKICKKQGAEQLVRFGEQLGLPNVDIAAGGCLGDCGNGPNIVLLPKRSRSEPSSPESSSAPPSSYRPQMLRHVSTPAKLAEVLRAFCGADVGEELLRATELRLAGNALAMAGDLQGAVAR